MPENVSQIALNHQHPRISLAEDAVYPAIPNSVPLPRRVSQIRKSERYIDGCVPNCQYAVKVDDLQWVRIPPGQSVARPVATRATKEVTNSLKYSVQRSPWVIERTCRPERK